MPGWGRPSQGRRRNPAKPEGFSRKYRDLAPVALRGRRNSGTLAASTCRFGGAGGERMAGPAQAPHYAAFLSYSHKDAAIAARIHRRLERYRIPRRLVGRETERGAVPPRLWPVFRDREEMAASADLSETVQAALAESAALVVLCSPDAAASSWVAEEIATFRALHPERPVLAAIVAGTVPECFPQPLRRRGPDGSWHEPLATDLRREGDGLHLGLLKLVAGLTGVALDDLVQRDAQRRIRRVTAVTAGALVALLMMAALTVFALGARSEAERQRAEAEGLIEFMLTDLRDRLKGVGRLDAMEAVNARALGYYGGGREVADLPDESLARRARIIHAIGDDSLLRHDSPAALDAFREAHQATAELLARAPDDPQRISEHAKSDVGLARLHELREDWPMAERHYSAYAAAAARLVAIAAGNPDHMLKAASAAVGLGNVQLNGRRNFLAAQQLYESAVQWFARADRARPGDLHVLLSQANAYGWLADSFFIPALNSPSDAADSLWRRSLDARLRQHAIVERLHRSQPSNATIGFRLAAAQRGVAHSYARLEDRARARSHLFEAYEAAVRLTRQEPRNAEWRTLRRMLTDDLLRLGLGLPSGVSAAMLREYQVENESHHAPQPAHGARTH